VLEREHVRRSLPSRWDAVSQLYRPLAAAGWSIWHRFSFIPTSTAEKAPDIGGLRCVANRGSWTACALQPVKFANSPEARSAAAEERRRAIEELYSMIDEETRNRMRTVVEERIRRLDLVARPGDVEAAVIRLHERSRNPTIAATGQKNRENASKIP